MNQCKRCECRFSVESEGKGSPSWWMCPACGAEVENVQPRTIAIDGSPPARRVHPWDHNERLFEHLESIGRSQDEDDRRRRSYEGHFENGAWRPKYPR